MTATTIEIPPKAATATLKFGSRDVRLTNLSKVFFPDAGYTKRDLLTYYAAMADVLVPHLKDRAMVMKRYPNGIDGKFFFAKRTPAGAPEWLKKCHIEHGSGSIIDFPMRRWRRLEPPHLPRRAVQGASISISLSREVLSRRRSGATPKPWRGSSRRRTPRSSRRSTA